MTDTITTDGVRLSSGHGGWVHIFWPAGWVDDQGDPFVAASRVRGWDRAEAVLATVRDWQS